MASETKAKPGAASGAAQVEAETQDEIAQIMSEIETLQKNMAEAPHLRPAGALMLKAVPGTPAAVPVAVEEVGPDGMADFRGGAGDVSLEDTLSGIKSETSGSSLFDDPGTTDYDSQVPVGHEDSNGDGLVAAEAGPEAEAAEAVVEEDQVTEEVGTMARDYDSNEKDAATEGSLSMVLKGSMTLQLQYEFDGQEVTIGFSDGNLRVTLADGTEFKVPVSSNRGSRAA